jgi:AP2 domain
MNKISAIKKKSRTRNVGTSTSKSALRRVLSIIPMKEKVQKKSSIKKSYKCRQPVQHPLIDLSDVPRRDPIFKTENIGLFYDNSRPHKVDPELSSKYVGVYYHMGTNKWRAQIMIDSKVYNLGDYVDEEEAGSIYATAAYKYKRQSPFVGIYGGLDLRNIPDQPYILRSEHDRTVTMYKGIKKCKGRWQARISMKGRDIHLGTFDTMEEAAQVYSNAAYYLQNEFQHISQPENPPKNKNRT